MTTSCRTRTALASVLLLVIASPPARAVDVPESNVSGPSAPDTAASKTPTRETYAKILADFQAAQQEFSKVHGAAKDNAARQKAYDEKYPNPGAYATRFLAFAEARPRDPNAVDALVWVATYTRSGDAHAGALQLLSDSDVESDKLAQACLQLAYSEYPRIAEVLRTIAQKNPSPQVKGAATFALGQYLLGRDRRAEAEKAFEEVAAKYPDVAGYRGTLGQAAKANIHEIRELVIGKAAPEIEGEDVDGKKFKLSEYRGKVVVLDFWGDW